MPLLPPSSLLQSVLVVMEPWTGARAFAVNKFYKNGDSFVIMVFHLPMPSRPWFKTTAGSILKKKGGSV
jgi:hypothetical protein